MPNPTVKEFTLDTVFELLRKHKLSIVVWTLVITTGFLVYALLQTPKYKAETLLSAEPLPGEDYIKANTTTVNMQDKLWLIRERLYNPTLLDPIIQDFHLDREPDNLRTRVNKELQTLLDKLTFASTSGQGTAADAERRMDEVKRRITIRVEAPDAFLIGYEGRTRQEAMNVANRMADLLVARTSAISEKDANMTADFLQSEAQRIKAVMDRQAEQVRSYQQHTSDDLPVRLATDLRFLQGMQEQLHAKGDQIANEQARRQAVEQELSDLQKRGAVDTAVKSPDEIKLSDLRAKLAQLQTQYTDRHPEIKDTKREIQKLEKVVAEAGPQPAIVAEPSASQMRAMQLKAELQEIDQRLKSYQQQQKDTSAELAGYRRSAETAPASERALALLMRDYDMTREQYAQLQQKANQAQISERLQKVGQSSIFRIVSPARLPLNPSSPQRSRLALMGLFAGMVMGFGMAFLSEFRDTTFDDGAEFQTSFNYPVLAAIPSITLNGNHSPSKPTSKKSALVTLSVSSSLDELTIKPKPILVTINEPRSIAAEQFGILAMEIRQRLVRNENGGAQAVAITSATGAEGKTMTALNLAVSLGRTMDGKVLLVEADLRKPRMHDYVGFRADKGLSTLLRKPDEFLESYIWKMNGVSVLPGGPALEDPLRYLTSREARNLFTRLRQEYDFIVVDTPPIFPIADAKVIADLVDGVLIVVRARQTRRELIEHALENFQSPKIIGVALNGVNLRQSRYYEAYEYYSNHYLGQEKRKTA